MFLKTRKNFYQFPTCILINYNINTTFTSNSAPPRQIGGFCRGKMRFSPPPRDAQTFWGKDEMRNRTNLGIDELRNSLHFTYNPMIWIKEWSEWKLALLKCGRIENFMDELTPLNITDN